MIRWPGKNASALRRHNAFNVLFQPRWRAPHVHNALNSSNRSMQTADEDDSENVDVEATPRPAKSKGKGKKRVSDVFHPSNGDVGSSPHRVPLGTVNINDDEAEKRKRRKSAKILQPMMVINEADGTPQSSQEGGANDTPRANRHLKQKQQLMSVAETPVINVPLDVDELQLLRNG